MRILRAKNLIITFFVLLAVYQTGRLWFEDYSNHSLFKLSTADSVAGNDTAYTSLLESILIGNGNGQIIKRCDNYFFSEYKEDFDNAIYAALNKGDFIGEEEINWNSTLKGKFIIYEYNFEIENKNISKLFSVSSRKTSEITKATDNIIIIPNTISENSLTVIFINTKESKGFKYIVKSESAKKVMENINMFIEPENELYYISSDQNGFDVFEKNVFIPAWNSNNFSYNSIVAQNPLSDGESVIISKLESYVNVFFKNPAAKWPSTVNGIYTYSDDNTVVKYYTNGVLEYSGYTANDSKNKGISFFDNYNSASAFLNRDTNIKNDYYLKDYLVSDGKITFYFNYRLNNIPILLSQLSKKKTGMNSFIEVTCENGKVTKYKRYICDFYLNTDIIEFITTDFLKAIDNAIIKHNLETGKENFGNIKNAKLAYCYNGGTIISIKWFVNIDGKIYTL